MQAGHILDMYDDAFGVHLVDGLIEKYGNIKVDHAQSLSSVPDKDFALVVFAKTGERHRKFPMHTPDALAISTHYFEKTGQALMPAARVIVASNLAMGHLRFGAEVPDELKKLASDKVDGNSWDEGVEEVLMTGVPAPAQRVSKKYAIRRERADGSVVEMFPIDTIKDCQASAAELKKVAYDLSARDRYEAAVAVGAQLSLFAQPDPVVEKLASLDPNPAFMTHIAARMEMLLDEQSRTTLDTLSKLAGALPGVKLAEALEAFDKKAGISFHWDRRIRNPFDSCFQAKTASVKAGGRTVTAQDLVRLIDGGKLTQMFKTSTLKDFREQPLEVFQSLPDPLKNEIAQLI